MKQKRRDFLKISGLTGIGIAGSNLLNVFGATINDENKLSDMEPVENKTDAAGLSVIGLYGSWAAGLNDNKLPLKSFRRNEFKNLQAWRNEAKNRLKERLAIPDLGGLPKATVNKQYEYDGLHIEELSWQLPYGRATEAILLKPVNATGKLPAILAFHDHGGNKYFGTRKITRTADEQHPLMKDHQQEYYEGMAWANEIAKRGYVVLVSDAFPFASRRVML